MKLFKIILVIAITMLITVPAYAGGNSGVWAVQLVEDGTVTAADDGGVSIFVIDATAKNHYTGNVMVQYTGVTLSSAAATYWPPGLSTGISVYYANMTWNPASGSSPYDLVNWTLLEATGDTLRSGNTYQAFDVPFDPAAPFCALKFVNSGGSPFAYGVRYSTSGNP